MLSEITIENVAVIEKATATFQSGFNVLTGETGAGKSILIDSINTILGNRASRDIVRGGAAKARIWATFSNLDDATKARLEEAGYTPEEELLLYREVTADGKTGCRINGAPATAAVLRDICSGLLTIHGQHDNQSLLDPTKHLAVLDAFADNAALLGTYAQSYAQLVEVRRQKSRLGMDEDEKRRRLELLRYEVEEIDAAALTEGEEEELAARRDTIRHAQGILEALDAATAALAGGDEESGATTLLRRAADELASAARFAADLQPFADQLDEMYYTAGEIASDLERRLGAYDFNPRAIDEVEGRLDLIYRLKQKYGAATVEEVLRHGERARQELDDIAFSEERLAKLAAEEAAATQKTTDLAEQLSAARLAGFERLSAQVTEALAFLNMPGIVLTLALRQVPLGPTGFDDLAFYISTNPGETPKPMAKIASGGELARIMLAIKSALADRDALPTVIYDEIDTGISGLAAGRIGQMLRDTAKGRQVICVTHTAQVAAFAARHLLIEKNVHEGRSFTEIRELSAHGRVEELARIISGDHVTGIAKANAEEMLRHAAEA